MVYRFRPIFEALNKAKIQYLVVGGVAVNFHGYLRFTSDMDFIISFDEKNLQNFDKVMKELGYESRLPIKIETLQDINQVKIWMKEKNLKAYSYFPKKGLKLIIDIIIEESLDYDIIKDRCINKKTDDLNIPIVGIDDLISMKKKAQRPKDLEDIEALNKLKEL